MPLLYIDDFDYMRTIFTHVHVLLNEKVNTLHNNDDSKMQFVKTFVVAVGTACENFHNGYEKKDMRMLLSGRGL